MIRQSLHFSSLRPWESMSSLHSLVPAAVPIGVPLRRDQTAYESGYWKPYLFAASRQLCTSKLFSASMKSGNLVANSWWDIVLSILTWMGLSTIENITFLQRSLSIWCNVLCVLMSLSLELWWTHSCKLPASPLMVQMCYVRLKFCTANRSIAAVCRFSICSVLFLIFLHHQTHPYSDCRKLQISRHSLLHSQRTYPFTQTHSTALYNNREHWDNEQLATASSSSHPVSRVY